MDRRRAAGALLALAACIASSAAAPTASNQTALDLYDETAEGCYYNFQHYGEGDRIMTNEPCLNCTCHNRMLMCYLRVCPFTKAIGQDCTVEKRADQCCPIVTCPDVPVDLLTSTSTSSPAEYGGTGVGKVDKYGCTINDKYFSEGAKVPPTPGKPCEHCYCIRNMTTCVMQECTLHVDGCTPIYHKDVCCPVRYYCDHPEDEMPLLDDMTTTVRPTPGFLLTTAAPTEPPTTTLPVRRDCIEDDQLYSDGALIKTDKPCEHCYCMKGDIVCVVQECGTPMENEGKNCTSLPPREGQCCPDTYICEGDELSTEVPITETLIEEPVTTVVPPRRASVEGSGYRNEPDEVLYTEVPTFATEMEGSGEGEFTETPVKESTEKYLTDRFGPTEEAEFIPLTTQVSVTEQPDIVTTEPDKGLNTVPSGIFKEESTESALQEKTTSKYSEQTKEDEQSVTSKIPSEFETSSEPHLETSTPIHEIKVTEQSIVEKITTGSIVDFEKDITKPIEMETTLKEDEQTESFVPEKPETYITVKPEDDTLSIKEPTTTETATASDLPSESAQGGGLDEETQQSLDASVTPTTLGVERTTSPLVKEKDEILPSSYEGKTTVSPTDEESEGLLPGDERKTTVSAPMDKDDILPSVDEIKTTVLPPLRESEPHAPDSRRTTLDLYTGSTPKVEDKTEAPPSEYITPTDKLDITEPEINEQNTVPIGAEEDQSTEVPELEKTTMYEESRVTELPSITKQEKEPAKPLEKESSEQPVFEITTSNRNTIDTSESTTGISKEEIIPVITTEVIFKKDEEITSTESVRDKDEEITSTESVRDKEPPTKGTVDVAKETMELSGKATSTEKTTISEYEETEMKLTTLPIPEQQEVKEATTESIMELSTFAHVSEKELASTLHPESTEGTTATAPEKSDLPQYTTINPADNEIGEVPSPGRIPGEGDCLLEGTTYQNDSIVPSMNKCHSGCKCVSSIIKCNPIICSPPPEDMDNCQPRYDTPEACCPTYVCDHGMETIPPESQSHITGTESPTSSTIECHGVDCVRHDDKPSQTPEKIANDCGSSSCDQTIQSPTQPPKELEKPPEPSSLDTSQSCANPDDCKEIKIPESCEGKSCADGQDSPCDKESGCIIKPDEIPIQETPHVCTNEEECKQVKIPQPESVPCEGESCTSVQEDCSTGECKIISVPPQPSRQGEECSKENGCIKPDQAVETPQICTNEEECKQVKIPQPESVPCEGESCTSVQEDCSTGECKIISGPPQPSREGEECSKENGCTKPDQAIECESGKCVQKEVDTKEIVCSGDICTQQQPTLPTEETAHTESINTESPAIEKVTTKLEEETELVSSKLPTTFSEGAVTVQPTVSSAPNKETKEPESPVSDEEDRVTKSPEEVVTSHIPKATSLQPVNEVTDAEQKYTEISPEIGITETPQEHSTVAIKTDETALPVSSITEESPQNEYGVTKEKTEYPEKTTEFYDVQTDKPESIEKETEVPKQQYNETKPTEIPESQTSRVEESTKEPETTDSPETSAIEAEKETTKPEEPEKSSTGSQMPEIITVSLSEETTKLPKISESGINLTEPSVQESQETEYPEISTSSGELVTKTEPATKSPAMIEAEITTSSYEIETISTHVTEQQDELTKVPTDDKKKNMTTPEYPVSKDEGETTTRVSDITQAVVSADTKLPESLEKYTTTEIPMKPTALDENVPTEYISVEQMPEKHISTTEQSDIVTLEPHIDFVHTSIVDSDVIEKVTTLPETTIFEKEKDVESSLSHVTESSQPVSIVSIITESNELSSTASPKEEEYDAIKTTAPEFDVTKETRPSDTEKTEAPQEAITEQKAPVESTTEQELITEIPSNAITESSESSVIEQQSSVKPPSSDSEDFLGQEPVTNVSVETETSVIPTKTSSLPSEPTTIGEKVEEVTEPREPSISEEHEISTEAPEKELQEPVTPDLVQDILTKEPELYLTVSTHADKPTESQEEVDKEQASEKPIFDFEKEDTAAPDSSDNQLPVLVTESQDIAEHVPEEKVTTEIPVSDEKETETSGDFITKQIFTESPESTAQTEIMHHELTTTPKLVDIDSQKPSTEKPAYDDLPTTIPELQSTEEHEVEKEGSSFTSSPEQPVKEAQTELPEIQQTTTKTQYESASPEISETTTISQNIEDIYHEEKRTEQPISLVTEPKPYTTAEPKDESITEQQEENIHEKEQELTESTPEKISDVTKSPIELSTMISVSEEDIQPEEPLQTSRPEVEHSETTPYLVELEEHTHKINDEEPTIIPSDEPSVASSEEPSITLSEESITVPSVGTAIVSSEEPTFTPSEKPASIPSEQPTVIPLEKVTVIPPKESTVGYSEQSTVAPIGEPTISLLGEPTVISSGEQTVASSGEPHVAFSEEPSVTILQEMTTTISGMHATEQKTTETVTEKLADVEKHTELPEEETERPSDHKELIPLSTEEPHITILLEEAPDKSTESIIAVETTSEIVKTTDELVDKYGSPEDSKKEGTPTTLKPDIEDENITSAPSIETDKPALSEETVDDVTIKPQFVPAETTAPEEEFIPVTTKVTTTKPEEEGAHTELAHSKPEDKPASTAMPEISKPDEMQPVDEVPSPEDESHFPPSGGYNQEPDYVEEDQAFGPGTCRYGGKVYVSAQQIPRDDPCDFCFCFRSDIICLQQSCPPPIHGCHEEPIQGFCCPRYECPVSMATTLNVTTTTTTTTTTLPPHFLPHAYKGAATRKGCQIKGHTYQVGEVVRASSGPCLHCTCGGDGQMKCDPKQCTPEPMLRQMIAAAVSAKRRR